MEYFSKIIKPHMENFLKNPTKETVRQLEEIINNADWSECRLLDSYILAPLILKLDKLEDNNSMELQCEIINCIKSVIKKSRIKNINQLRTTLIILLKQIHDFNTGLTRENLSEEIKLAVLSSITEILKKSNTDVLENFYSKQNSNIIGKIASTCVDVLQFDKYKKLRMFAIECLQSIFFVHNEADFNDKVLRNQVADCTFYFLPKIVAVLTEVALSESKIGDTLILLSIRVLGRILHIIYEDNEQSNIESFSIKNFTELISQPKQKSEETDDQILGSNMKNKSVEEKIKIMQDLTRNKVWFEATSKKLQPIFKKLQILQSSDNENVRKEYILFIRTLIIECSYNLNENITLLLESMIALSQDQCVENSILCQKVFQNNFKENTAFFDWESIFCKHLITLPRIIKRNEQREQLAEFLFLQGFFKHIPVESLTTLFSIPKNVEKFIDNIIEALDLVFSIELLHEECPTRKILYYEENLEWRKFKNISSENVIKLIIGMCAHIGKSDVDFIFFNYLTELLNQAPMLSNEIYLLLTFMFASTNDNLEKKLKYIELLLNELSDENHWHLVFLPEEPNKSNCNSSWYVDRTPGLYESTYEVRTTDIDLDVELNIANSNDTVKCSDAQFNVLYTCIILNLIGNSALVMNANFKKYIFKYLHKILLKSNCSNYMVQKEGLFALDCLAKALGYTEISKLVHDYSDYLSYHINISLRRIDLSDFGIEMLAVYLNYSSLESFSYLENILNTLLDEIVKTTQTNSVLSYLKVFNIFLINIYKWVEKIDRTMNNSDDIAKTSNKNEEFLTSLKSILNKVDEFPVGGDLKSNNEEEVSKEYVEQEDDNQNLEHNNEEEVLKDNVDQENDDPNLPNYVVLVVKILKSVLKYLPSKDKMYQILSLECLISGLPVLKDYENELLPLVHLIWYPFSERFALMEPVILIRCFTLLETLADCSKSFLQNRVLKDIIKYLDEFLNNSLKISMKTKNLTPTQELKLQLKLLKGFGKIIIDLEVEYENLEKITDTILLYLNKNQPESLQDSARSYFLEISKYNKPLIYVKLLQFKNELDYKKNVEKIFDLIKIL